MSETRDSDTDALFVRRLVLTILVFGTAWLFWHLRYVFVLAFGAILFGVILGSAARFLNQKLLIAESLSLTAALLLILGVTGTSLGLFGAEIAGQANAISDALPVAVDGAKAWAASLGFGEWLDRWLDEFRAGTILSGSLGGILMSVGDGLTNVIILLVGGIFFASKPHLYRIGVIKLVPAKARPYAATALDDCHTALRLWLKGRLLAMAMVGVLTGFGLWLIGVPSYLALALLSGMLEFIPFFGPIIAAVPAILLALMGSPTDALLVATLFLLVQQLEGYLISPLVQQHAVDLPPALLLFSLLSFGLLFGIIGIVLAEPLTVAIFVLTKRLYVREALGTKTPMPGGPDE